MTTTCPSCGIENPEGQKFCGECGSRLGSPTRRLAEERKIVTSLFCDLAGFTAASESADPEDVDRMLAAYFEMARTQIEAFGGVVEKFIGDAVVGVFGVPAAHEDDPERAVRAALRICEAAEGLESLDGRPLRLRVGINTGEALVRLDVTAGSEKGLLTGDSVNTASRIQSVAPEMGVAVGLPTYEATAGVFDYEELEPASLKGKSEPVRIFHPRSPLARLGTDLPHTHGSAYVGREADLSLLRSLFDKTVTSEMPNFAMVTGEPGIGKSRIVAELLAHAQSRQPRLTWRQGRCLPYGDGVTFWALGEIVKAHAGILETDDPPTATSKLGEVLLEGPDREWMRQRLLPLVGVNASSSAGREELFAAWSSFLEAVAEQSPTVLVFEDIHWADDAMLAFLEHLADRAEGVPLLLVASARPELFERHATFGQGLHNLNRVNLVPLTDGETAELVSGLLEGSEIPADLRSPILERAEGNPLYVEEFVRLIKDEGLVTRKAGTWSLRPGAELPLPGSVQSLIAARLDTLPPERKAMLADAAVLGKVFWSGAVAEMGNRPLEEVTAAMRDLSRKELIRPARRSSMAGEHEYAFWHILTRDVAYSQLPRASRVERHISAARWLEAKAAERLEDICEVLAHHYAMALELSRAAGQTEKATALESPAIRFLSLSGERAANLDPASALEHFERAFALTPPEHEARPKLQDHMAVTLQRLGRAAEAAGRAEEAAAQFEARSDHAEAAAAMVRWAAFLIDLGQKEKPHTLVAASLERLQPLGPSEALCRAFQQASVLSDHGDPRKKEYEDRAIAMADELGLVEQQVVLLARRGRRRLKTGEGEGMDDLRSALARALESEMSYAASGLYDWLTYWLPLSEGHRAALAVAGEGLQFSRRRGQLRMARAIRADRLVALLAQGAWAEVLAEAESVIEEARVAGDFTVEFDASIYKAAVLSLMGRVAEAGELARGVLERESGPFDPVSSFVVPRLAGLRAEGRLNEAIALVESWAALAKDPSRPGPGEAVDLHMPYFRLHLSREAVALGRADLAEVLAAVPPLGFAVQAPAEAASLEALLAEKEGRLYEALAAFRAASQAWRFVEEPYETAMADLGVGRCLLGVGRASEAVTALQEAGEIFERLGAAAFAEKEALLQQAVAVSS